MITVTPATKGYSYSNQDFDEQQRLVLDLAENRRDYLAHSDAEVRSLADWSMEHLGLRTLRPGFPKTDVAKRDTINRLYKRLRHLAG
jgi:hypothetical protein